MRILFAAVASAFYGLMAGLLLGFVASALVMSQGRDESHAGLAFGIMLVSVIALTTVFGIAGVRSARRQRRPGDRGPDRDDSPPPPTG
jgi:predicted lipid-binding transport protein (Tim44 family)